MSATPLLVGQPVPTRPLHPPPPVPAHYVLVPRRLLADTRSSLVALAVYALLGRLFRIYRQPIALSVNDVCRFDPMLSPGAARRALDRLVELGWLQGTPTVGHKASYVPTWGRVGGTVRPWDLEAPNLGLPRHMAALRLDQRLFDTCIGRLIPHEHAPACIERYLVSPLLSLRDISLYARSLNGAGETSTGLSRLGLIHAGYPRPLADDSQLLALTSQQGMCHDPRQAALTVQGYQRLGITVQAMPEEAPITPLVFVPPEVAATVIANVSAQLIGQCGGQLIGCATSAQAVSSASQSAEMPQQPTGDGSHGVMEQDREESTTTTSTNGKNGNVPELNRKGGGGGVSRSDSGHRTPRPHTAAIPQQIISDDAQRTVRGPRAQSISRAPDLGSEADHGSAPEVPATTPAVERLRRLGVRSEIARTLADRSTVQIERVVQQALARGGVRDMAAWVVSALRALPSEEPEPLAPPPRVSDQTILDYNNIDGHQRLLWLQRFRGAPPHEQAAIMAQFQAKYPPDADTPRPPTVSEDVIQQHPTISVRERMNWLRQFYRASSSERANVIARFQQEYPDEPSTQPTL